MRVRDMKPPNLTELRSHGAYKSRILHFNLYSQLNFLGFIAIKYK